MESAEYTEEVRQQYVIGKGSWSFVTQDRVDRIKQVAREVWAPAIEGLDYPWLCWNVDEDWCLVQQRMVRSVGWTPVVGYDPRVGAPSLIEGAVQINFNEGLDLPAMSMMFPLEWVFLFAPRLAFWHSDLLIREPLLQKLADDFKRLSDGESAAVDVRAKWYRRLLGHTGRYWELIGCTTQAASRSQFECGCGWWRRPLRHINCPDGQELTKREKYYYDHGSGILIWQERCHGRVRPIAATPVEEGHCSRIGNKHYKPQSPTDHRRNLNKDLSSNYDLRDVCAGLGISRFLDQPET